MTAGQAKPGRWQRARAEWLTIQGEMATVFFEHYKTTRVRYSRK